MEQRSLKQHALYFKIEVEPGNLMDALRVTGGYSKDVRKATIKRMRRYLRRLEVEEGANIYILHIIIKDTIISIFIIKLASETSPSKLLKIQDEKKEIDNDTESEKVSKPM